MYDTNQVKNIAYIRYLQMNGLTLKEISQLAKSNSGVILSASILQNSNLKHQEKIKRISRLIEINEKILEILEKNLLDEDNVYEIIVKELKK